MARQILPRGRRWLEMAARACPGAAAGSKVLLEPAPEPPCARKCCSSLAGPRNGVETRVSLTLCLCRTRQLKKIYIYIYIYIYISKYREALRASPATVPFLKRGSPFLSRGPAGQPRYRGSPFFSSRRVPWGQLEVILGSSGIGPWPHLRLILESLHPNSGRFAAVLEAILTHMWIDDEGRQCRLARSGKVGSADLAKDGSLGSS